ncbi:hypothetical protein [Staphylococcus chromogenes]|uniref:hypothetical protein n=1 Tax=Staphylococcus chromogenes TaxID=46126 RepID=UPI001E3FAB3B|nr:hypothetical protein [Staphylococcus chromogenes]
MIRLSAADTSASTSTSAFSLSIRFMICSSIAKFVVARLTSAPKVASASKPLNFSTAERARATSAIN